VDLEGGWSGVAGAGWFSALLESITVVVLAFHGSGAGPVTTLRVEHPGDLGENVG
jgi:hypothetical protein